MVSNRLALVAPPGMDRLLALVAEHVGDGVRLSPSSLAAEVKGWNSMAMVNILFAVEDVYGVEFTSQQMERVDGVPSLIAVMTDAGAALG